MRSRILRAPLHFLLLGLLLVSYAAISEAAYVNVVAADNPVHWWRFEDTSSTNGATALDSAGSGNGTYSGNVSFEPGVLGITGQSARFDGSFDSVRMGNLGALPSQGSIELWIYPEVMQNHRNPFTTGPLGSTSTGNRAIRFEAKTGGTLQTYIGNDSATTQPQFSQALATGISINEWHHVALTWDTNAGTVDGYLDGVSTLSTTNTFFPSLMSDVRVGMGWGNFAERSWLGRVDEVAIYNYELSTTQITDHISATTPVPLPGALWLFISGLAGLFLRTKGTG